MARLSPISPRAPARVDQEHRHEGADHHPQPRPLASCAPARLVDVDELLLLYVPVGFGAGRGPRRTHRLLARPHRAQGCYGRRLAGSGVTPLYVP